MTQSELKWHRMAEEPDYADRKAVAACGVNDKTIKPKSKKHKKD